MAGATSIVEHCGPLLPAETTTKMPAAAVFSTTARRMFGSVHPSRRRQPHELLITSGARSGRGLAPVWSVGARKNSKHSA